MDFEPQTETWPLRRGETLSNHDWFPFYGHRFIGSGFVGAAIMERRRGDIGTAVILWAESMRQDPAGTLPDCDVELASLAKCASIEEWRSMRAGVLYGWVPVVVEDDRTGETFLRLGHVGFMLKVVSEMAKRKRGRDGAREAARLSVRKTRIRKKMSEMRIQEHIIGDDRAVVALAEYFEHSDLYVTADNLRAAMIEVLGYTGEVVHLPNRRAGDG